MMELFVGDTINNKIVSIRLFQEGENTFRINISIDFKEEINKLFESTRQQAITNFRYYQVKYLGKVKNYDN